MRKKVSTKRIKEVVRIARKYPKYPQDSHTRYSCDAYPWEYEDLQVYDLISSADEFYKRKKYVEAIELLGKAVSDSKNDMGESFYESFPYKRKDTKKYLRMIERRLEKVLRKVDKNSDSFSKAQHIFSQLNEEREHSSRKDGLETYIPITIAMIGIIGGIFFLSNNLTGNVIGMSQITSNWIRGILFIMGIIWLVFYLRKKKR